MSNETCLWADPREYAAFEAGIKGADARAMAVVEACLEYQHRRGLCFFCKFWPMHDEHADDCPLVAQGFIDKEGRRL
jgi:hypothetical protein